MDSLMVLSTKSAYHSNGDDTANWGLDEIELNFLLNAGSVSGQIALDSQNIGSRYDDDIEIEQAHFHIQLGQWYIVYIRSLRFTCWS